MVGTKRALAVAGLICVALILGAADWPTYMGNEQREGASSEPVLSPSNAGQLNKALSYKTGGIVAASTSVVNGIAYVGSWDGYEYAINAAAGTTLWRTYLGVTTTTCKPVITLGVSSSATISNGVVYVGGGGAYWYALDAAT